MRNEPKPRKYYFNLISHKKDTPEAKKSFLSFCFNGVQTLTSVKGRIIKGIAFVQQNQKKAVISCLLKGGFYGKEIENRA